jgi:predicted nucleic acid-binding Zn ribbon protein
VKTCTRCSILISDDAVLCPNCEAALKKERDRSTRKTAETIAAIALFADLFGTLIIMLNDKTVYSLYAGTVAIGSGLLCGLLLLSGNRKLIAVTRILIIVTGIVLTIFISTGDTIFGPILRVFFTAALVSLITGIPKKVRFSISTAAVAVYLLSVLVIVQESFPGTSISGVGGHTAYQSGKSHKRKKQHRKAPKVSIPHRQWKKTEGDHAAAKHPKALQWLEYPEFDAQVLILQDSVALPDTIDHHIYLDSILTHARFTLPHFMIVDKTPVATKQGLKGTSVIVHGSSGSKSVFHQYALFTSANYAYQIVCISNEETFNEVKGDFSRIIKSFKP